MLRRRNAIAIAGTTAFVVGLGLGLYPAYGARSVPAAQPTFSASAASAPPSVAPPAPSSEPEAEASASPSHAASPSRTADEPESEAPATPTWPTTGEASTLTIVAGGDVLLHDEVNAAARTATGYDYTGLLSPISHFVSGADLALCGMETSLAPAGEAPSGYPAFGAPDPIVAALKATGWDGCSNANNHSADRGFAGISRTLDVFDAHDMGHSGTARSEEEAGQTQFYTLRAGGRDVKVAHLSYTNADNYIPSIPGKPWAWNVTTTERATNTLDDVVSRARQARSRGADIVAVSYHWGLEYDRNLFEQEITHSRTLAESGAVDVIFGSHPHVAQPVAKLDGGPDGQGMWVAYSMGNMISHQQASAYGLPVLTGILATATVDVPASGPARVTNLEWTAVTVDQATHKIYLLSDLEAGRQASNIADLPARRADIDAAMGTPERTSVPAAASEFAGQDRH